MKQTDFEKHLKTSSCILVREGGNHSIWMNTINNKKTSVPRHKEIDNMLCLAICKQLNILPTAKK